MKKVILLGMSSIFCLSLFCSCGNKDKAQNETETKSDQQIETKPQTEAFLEKSTPTKITTESGLQYEILEEAKADSKSPEAGQRVAVHYTGWLEENGDKGKKFDSSVDRGQPIKFVVGQGQVIKGWDEGLMLMKVGEKGRLTIPSNLAYGTNGAGNVIPPNATLIFDVELLEVA